MTGHEAVRLQNAPPILQHLGLVNTDLRPWYRDCFAAQLRRSFFEQSHD